MSVIINDLEVVVAAPPEPSASPPSASSADGAAAERPAAPTPLDLARVQDRQRVRRARLRAH